MTASAHARLKTWLAEGNQYMNTTANLRTNIQIYPWCINVHYSSKAHRNSLSQGGWASS